MADTFFDRVYKNRATHVPDVLSCLANLSNDEVFTPPEVVNQMLDMLPQELFSDPNTTFLDPACKTGVFLREIAKRLLEGLKDLIPDLQERIDHIFHNQLFGIGITELTSLLSRRSLYCSKYPNGQYSITHFDDAEGNIRFKRIEHTWDKNGKCVFCGASKGQWGRGDDLETHAYEFIHLKPERIFNMKFDVIISNPPYQLNTGGGSAQAIPLYDKFVTQAKKLAPRYMAMIIPSRWFAGGMSLDGFRAEMLNDSRIRKLVDFSNAKDCFPQSSIGGGVCYFLWDREHPGLCDVTNNHMGKTTSLTRRLNEHSIFVRYNEAISVLKKVASLNEQTMDELCSSLSPFGINSSERGNSEPLKAAYSILYSSKGKGYIPETDSLRKNKYYDCFKVMVSKTTAEHAGEPDRDGTFKVLSTLKMLRPKEVCTFSYFVIAGVCDEVEAQNMIKYLKTKFSRFLILQAVSSINLTKDKFCFLPVQNWSKEYSDEDLYEKYKFSEDEVAFIESMVRSYDGGDE